jgi:hypothetical protein
VVERMQVLVVAAPVAEDLEGPVAEHFVGVHVGRSAGTALDHVDHEFLVQLALAHLLAGEADGDRAALVDQLELAVGDRRRLLHARQRAHQVRIQRDRHARDREVLQGAQGMDAVVSIGRHGALAQQVMLDAGGAGHSQALISAVLVMASNSGTIMLRSEER